MLPIVSTGAGVRALHILATADVHAPKYLGLFREALNSCRGGDVLLLAGDLVLRNNFAMISAVVSTIRGVFQGDIFACFGNEEYAESEDEYLKNHEIKWLRDEKMTLSDDEGPIDLVGSRGSLDRPTFWQRRYVKNIWREYAERPHKLREILKKCESQRKIVVTHYSPTYLTLVGEDERIWPELGSKKYEPLMTSFQPNVWIHGHAHSSQQAEVIVGETRVINVSLPSRRRIVEIDL
jgi:Icc-related predicted phosphoesterase